MTSTSTHPTRLDNVDILVAYDVDTTTKAGEARLRKVAKICKRFGQRVQFSVFECRVTQAQYEELVDRLRQTMKEETDSLRIYRLPADRESAVTTYGVDQYTDFDDPLIF